MRVLRRAWRVAVLWTRSWSFSARSCISSCCSPFPWSRPTTPTPRSARWWRTRARLWLLPHVVADAAALPLFRSRRRRRVLPLRPQRRTGQGPGAARTRRLHLDLAAFAPRRGFLRPDRPRRREGRHRGRHRHARADCANCKSAEDEDNPSTDLRIISPTVDGYVVRRVFSELPGLYKEAEAEAKTLACASEPLAK